ncbi:hypothetical protein [Pseudoclavibacter soli]|uniref:hypothetical protein n=1 Tax=Pseudoclavibacter soli TaxID=452623 RepID=UPI0003FD382A|nr:hypothetical protein [Pseudoclavibacter soli]
MTEQLPFTPKAERLRQEHARFLEQTADHRLTVIRESGVYRHLRMSAPGTGIWHWDIITWPGYLAIVGDVADGFTFARVTDMLGFFRTRSGADDPDEIDYRYWAEKLQGRRSDGVQKFGHDDFLEAVYDDLFQTSWETTSPQAERRAREEGYVELADGIAALRAQIWEDAQQVSDPYEQQRGYIDWLADYVVNVPTVVADALTIPKRWAPWADDYYEMSLTHWSNDFLIACWAIAKTVQAWDAHVSVHGATDGFTVTADGFVRNERLAGNAPVYDLTGVEDADADTLADLFWRMVRDPNRCAIRPYLELIHTQLVERLSGGSEAELQRIQHAYELNLRKE